MRGNDLSREMERKKRKVCNDDERKEEKSIDHRVKRKKKFDPNFHYALLRFSASNGREERRRALHPRSSSLTKQTKNFTFFKKKKKLISLSLSLTLHSSCAKIPLCAKFCVSGELHFKKTLFVSCPNAGAKSEAMAAKGRIIVSALMVLVFLRCLIARFATCASALDAMFYFKYDTRGVLARSFALFFALSSSPFFSILFSLRVRIHIKTRQKIHAREREREREKRRVTFCG